uniref:Uncharacterized protein n=1 Tax=Nelumbo nucifera TaxID=4432 RepID=A0A822ZN29_NELNU|nr:TPA_asm: hypothetical protein HUJ06_002576 [Nelumbo nucifera]
MCLLLTQQHGWQKYGWLQGEPTAMYMAENHSSIQLAKQLGIQIHTLDISALGSSKPYRQLCLEKVEAFSSLRQFEYKVCFVNCSRDGNLVYLAMDFELANV